MIFSIWAYTALSLSFWANPDQIVYPPSVVGTVKNVFVGKLTCAARLNDLTHVQFWCSKEGEVIHNQIDKISIEHGITAVYGDTLQRTWPEPVEDIATIRWWFGYPEFNPTTVVYTVTYRTGPAAEKTLYGQF